MSRGADSGQKTVGFGWSRADKRETGTESRELVELLGSNLCSISTTYSEGDLDSPPPPSGFAWRDPSWTNFLFCLPTLHSRVWGTRTYWCRVWRQQWAHSATGSREGLFWPALHPYLATNLKPGSPFGFFTFWLLYFFQVVPKLCWEKRGAFNKLPKRLTLPTEILSKLLNLPELHYKGRAVKMIL